MKFSELTPEQRKNNATYISARWQGLSGIVNSSLHTIVNYLFVLNTGALAAGMTYVAAKGSNPSIKVAIWLFLAGTVLCTLRAAADYYFSMSNFANFRTHVANYHDNKMTWEVLLDRDTAMGKWDWVLHVMGWASGFCCLVGIVIGIRSL